VGGRIEAEEGLSDLIGFRRLIAPIANRLAFGVTVQTMRIDSQEAARVMVSGSPQQPEVELKGLGFGDAMGVKPIMNGLVGGDEGKPVDQFKAFLGGVQLVS
jgi:hypothetical protein